MATHSSIVAWKVSWTEEPGGLQSMGSQRAGHDLAAKQQQRSMHSMTALTMRLEFKSVQFEL